MIHTGTGIPFANPSLLIPVAKEFPDVNIVLAHCGMMVMAGEMPLVLKDHPNVYADITWTSGFLVRKWSEEFGADSVYVRLRSCGRCGCGTGQIANE